MSEFRRGTSDLNRSVCCCCRCFRCRVPHARADLLDHLAVARDETPGRDVRQVLARYQEGGSFTEVYNMETLQKMQETMERRSKGIGGVIRSTKDDLRKLPAAQLGSSLTQKLGSGDVYQEQEKQEVNEFLKKKKSGGGLRKWLQARNQDDEERQSMKMQAYHEMMEKRARSQQTDANQ